MNADSFRSILSRRNIVPFTIFFLLALIVVCGFAAGTGQPSAEASVGNGRGNQIPPEFNPTPDKEFNDDDLKVKEQKKLGGKWGYGLGFDKEQLDDASAPVAVGAIQSLSGGGSTRG